MPLNSDENKSADDYSQDEFEDISVNNTPNVPEGRKRPVSGVSPTAAKNQVLGNLMDKYRLSMG